MKTTQHTALAPLRAIYRSARAGTVIDPRALLAATLDAVCADADTWQAFRAFDGIAMVRLDCVRGVDAAAAMRAARERGGWKAAITMGSILNQSSAWAAAMTAHYGPTGIHKDWTDENGCPSAALLARCPHIGEKMADAARRWENILAHNELHEQPTRWEHVATMAA